MEIYSDLVESVEKCIATCNNCVASCLNEENVQSMTTCIKLAFDCADTCQLTLKLLARDSNHTKSAVEFCREICSECAEECKKHDHEHCQQCAEACIRCETFCERYLESLKETVPAE